MPTEQPFTPNCVFIPEHAETGESIQESQCELLMLEGDLVYSRAEWESQSEPTFRKIGDAEFGYHPRGNKPNDGRVDFLPEIWVLKIEETWSYKPQLRSYLAWVYGVYFFNRRFVTTDPTTGERQYLVWRLGRDYALLKDTEEIHEKVNQMFAALPQNGLWERHSAVFVDQVLNNPCSTALGPGIAPVYRAAGHRIETTAIQTRLAIAEAVDVYEALATEQECDGE